MHSLCLSNEIDFDLRGYVHLYIRYNVLSDACITKKIFLHNHLLNVYICNADDKSIYSTLCIRLSKWVIAKVVRIVPVMDYDLNYNLVVLWFSSMPPCQLFILGRLLSFICFASATHKPLKRGDSNKLRKRGRLCHTTLLDRYVRLMSSRVMCGIKARGLTWYAI